MLSDFWMLSIAKLRKCVKNFSDVLSRIRDNLLNYILEKTESRNSLYTVTEYF